MGKPTDIKECITMLRQILIRAAPTAFLFLSACAEILPVAEIPSEALPEYDPVNPGPWCAAVVNDSGFEGMSDAQKEAAFEIMRNRGCFSGG